MILYGSLKLRFIFTESPFCSEVAISVNLNLGNLLKLVPQTVALQFKS